MTNKSIQVDELWGEIYDICSYSGITNPKLVDKLEALIQQKQLEARLDELKRLRDMPDSELESYGNEIEDRIAQLSTPPKKEEK